MLVYRNIKAAPPLLATRFCNVRVILKMLNGLHCENWDYLLDTLNCLCLTDNDPLILKRFRGLRIWHFNKKASHGRDMPAPGSILYGWPQKNFHLELALNVAKLVTGKIALHLNCC